MPTKIRISKEMILDAAFEIVEHNIHGLDIDKRAYQLAYFAVMMKARRYNRRILTVGIAPKLFAIKESNEIDMVIESDGMLHPLEIKRSVNPGSELLNAFELLQKASVPRGKGAILCMRSALSAIDSENFIVPIWMI